MSQARRTQAKHRATDCISHVLEDTVETSRKKFQEWLQPFEEDLSSELRDFHLVVEQTSLEPKENHLMIRG